ncbi:hypothetical protein L3V82_04145 [Thiotrichales bacterium 19S3-7]|nr:hypothetical protein [Thiotrichales bacterium 19S3-7]MCF6801866.1 hypothetical protein [Thiotrichales bacterium 19S3-11]
MNMIIIFIINKLKYILSLCKVFLILGILSLGLISIVYFNFYPDEFIISTWVLWCLRIVSVILTAIFLYIVTKRKSFSSYSLARKITNICGISIFSYYFFMSIFILMTDQLSDYYGKYVNIVYAQVKTVKVDAIKTNGNVYKITYSSNFGGVQSIILQNNLASSLKSNDSIIIGMKESFLGKNISYLKGSNFTIHFNPYSFIKSNPMSIAEELIE